MNTLSDELEWIDYLDSRYTMFEKHQQEKRTSDNITTNDHPNTTQTVTVNEKTNRETKKTKNLQEVDIDRIIILETPEEQRRSRTTLSRTDNGITENGMTTNYKVNGDWRNGVRENTFRVGKLDVTKIEQRTKEFQLMEEVTQIHRQNKVLSFSFVQC